MWGKYISNYFHSRFVRITYDWWQRHSLLHNTKTKQIYHILLPLLLLRIKILMCYKHSQTSHNIIHYSYLKRNIKIKIFSLILCYATSKATIFHISWCKRRYVVRLINYLLLLHLSVLSISICIFFSPLVGQQRRCLLNSLDDAKKSIIPIVLSKFLM